MFNAATIGDLIPEALYYASPLLFLAGLLGLAICVLLWTSRR